MPSYSDKLVRDANLVGAAPSQWFTKQTVWRGLEFRNAKRIAARKNRDRQFLSIAHDQRNNISKVIGNQMEQKINFQRYHKIGRLGQPKHICVLSGRAKGTIRDILLARYTFRRLLRHGQLPGFYKGK